MGNTWARKRNAWSVPLIRLSTQEQITHKSLTTAFLRGVGGLVPSKPLIDLGTYVMNILVNEVFSSRQQFMGKLLRYARELIFNGQLYQIIIKPWTPKRSLAQNRLYWAWMKDIASHVNESQGTVFRDEDMHDYFKELFLDYEIKEIFGKKIMRYKSTTSLGVKNFSEYLEAIELWAGEREIKLSHMPEYETAIRKAA